MTGVAIKTARLRFSWTQQDTAQRLGVTQAYLSMLERGTRPVSPELALRAVEVLDVAATGIPLAEYRRGVRTEFYFKQALGSLGYPGFAYLRGAVTVNPTELLMEALDSEDLDARVVEALPWLPLAFPEMNWQWLVANAKALDRQNRLAFAVRLASTLADAERKTPFLQTVQLLERSRLAVEDTLCHASMTAAERKWLREHRSDEARHWNLLTDLSVEQLDYADV